MLYQVLEEIEQARGPVLLSELSRKLGIDAGTLSGMVQFWVRKGRLRDDDAAIADEMACVGSCGSSCGGVSGCAFVVKLPKTYSVPAAPVVRSEHGGE
jgi:hypothetical protein